LHSRSPWSYHRELSDGDGLVATPLMLCSYLVAR
jgi:hypothetical protein